MKIIIFDDDPTGSQTVYGCPLLLNWDEKTLEKAFTKSSPLIFILANTRSLSSVLAVKRTREICSSIKKFFLRKGYSKDDYFYISRGDSTLRGHGVLEPEIIAEELGPFNATFHIPAFLEGGRTTENGIHYLNGIPVHKTDFGRDNIFGFSTSDLAKWIEEKSFGKIQADNILHVEIKQLDMAYNNEDCFKSLLSFLYKLENNISVVVDAKLPHHLETLVRAIKVVSKEKRFLFRTAASFINSLSELPPNPQDTANLVSLKSKNNQFEYKPGLIMVGSHVKLATDQLEVLLKDNSCEGLEIPVYKLADIFALEDCQEEILDLEEILLSRIDEILYMKKVPVLYTTREEMKFHSDSIRMNFGLELAEFMAILVGKINRKFGYIISKGGITTQILLQKGLNFNQVDLKGQILTGLSIVTSNSDQYDLPVVTFPGNLGNEKTLLEAFRLMESIF
ncbi:four-carbon acid sugar kinase family protein [Prochlorococcus marinus]|uniref:four-carbon acid sugar kinase family protein n=1 Tax=Prochlorococcus marinus TaxID=1219 RepID=UPI0022B3C16E|nr:four-carbon acid sugar kinase family protein [Prochlorococcus marinus]